MLSVLRVDGNVDHAAFGNEVKLRGVDSQLDVHVVLSFGSLNRQRELEIRQEAGRPPLACTAHLCAQARAGPDELQLGIVTLVPLGSLPCLLPSPVPEHAGEEQRAGSDEYPHHQHAASL